MWPALAALFESFLQVAVLFEVPEGDAVAVGNLLVVEVDRMFPQLAALGEILGRPYDAHEIGNTLFDVRNLSFCQNNLQMGD